MSPDEGATAAFLTGLVAGSLMRSDLPIKVEIYNPVYGETETVLPIVFVATGNRFEIAVRPAAPEPPSNALEDPAVH